VPAATTGRANPFADPATIAGAWLALLRANVRYWPAVWPRVRGELSRWERQSRVIADPGRRALARAKLREERFNVEVAATLATTAPRRYRDAATRAIVALQVMYDYLDLVTEQRGIDSEHARRLFSALPDALTASCEPRGGWREHGGDPADWGYLEALVGEVRRALAELPGARAIEEVARRSATRCADAEVASHAFAREGPAALERWARAQPPQDDPGWQERLAGGAAGVLALHALIAEGARAGASAARAARVDSLYLSIGALTMLDSVVDERADRANGEPNYLDLYGGDTDLMARRLTAVARGAATRAAGLPGGAHHVMTLVGVVAFYASAPQARGGGARGVTAQLERELSPLILPAAALMRGWRAAKRRRARARREGAIR